MTYIPYPDSDKALNEIYEFLLSDRKEHILEGGAGTGKSMLIQQLITKVFPAYQHTASLVGLEPLEQCYLCATTNSATEVLNKALTPVKTVRTVHGLFGIRLKKNYRTGDYDYDDAFSTPISDSLIIIDEASMIDPKLHTILIANSGNSKLLYVGDWKQLLGVKGTLPNYGYISKSYLTQIKRTSSPELKTLYEDMRQSVATTTLPKITLSPGIIDWFSDPDEVINFMLNNIDTTAIGAYTNNTVNAINAYIRESLGYGSLYVVGEKVIVSNVNIPSILKKEQEVIVTQVGNIEDYYPDKVVSSLSFKTVDYCVTSSTATAGFSKQITVPVCMDSYQYVLKSLLKNKLIENYFETKESITELRPKYASTCHKLQGVSKEIVMLSLGDIFSCRRLDDILRMLYVGVSRARERVIFFGDIPDKYKSIFSEN